ncbi:thioredoxin [Oxynema aestuarii]|jgi:thioredoxin 1|uniref:Thioredoxin n=1 Tax=Oxynema aestuarii AP17 TaxID=2064643 RepID=A0A6H1U6E4_9CYAN|nr:thioredoxin [Oxynema aestuarii]QIZ73199.1 thioredoxin [Oxynema aestuarii AP17]RMH73972.1 MAG: thioredoxin [Cyanobacteria bacterium J007]
MVLSVNEQTFKKEVLEATSLVLVHFWAPWCGPCRMIEPILSAFEQEWGEKLKIVGINADLNLKLASAYRLSTLPTLILFDRGQIVHRVQGLQNRDELYDAVRSFVTLDRFARRPESVSEVAQEGLGETIAPGSLPNLVSTPL